MKYHDPVMVEECIEGLKIKKDGIYVDATFGGGGHTQAILNQAEGVKVFGFDQDEDAQKEAEKIHKKGFFFILANFRYLKKYLKIKGIKKVDGILADLGVSSYQLNAAERGFSTRTEADLDMRMGQNLSLTAREIVNTYSEKELRDLFYRYGEIKNAKALAASIITGRINHTISTTSQLIEIALRFAPPRRENKYLAQVFQALRIEVNDELGALREFLIQTPEILESRGRLLVISYHSLEDRIVKNFMQHGKTEGEAEKDLYGNIRVPFRPVNKKPITPGEAEILKNNRARSAKLRIAEKY